MGLGYHLKSDALILYEQGGLLQAERNWNKAIFLYGCQRTYIFYQNCKEELTEEDFAKEDGHMDGRRHICGEL